MINTGGILSMETGAEARDFQRNALTAIANQDDIIFVTYSAIPDTEEKIKFTLAKILEKHNRVSIFTPVLSCIKELIANASKANAKKILMDEGRIKNPDNTEEVIRTIRSILNEEGMLEYGVKAKALHLSTRVHLKIQQNNLLVEVINNIPLSSREQKKITERIERSSKYDNIAEFYMENPDPEAEGMGLGLSMVVVLLKNINIPHRNFMVTTNGTSKTYARLLIPLS